MCPHASRTVSRLLAALALILTALPAQNAEGQETADGLQALWAHDLDSAQDALGAAVQASPRDGTALGLLAVVLDAPAAPRDERRARRALRDALALSPENPRLHEEDLRQLERRLSESKANSISDSRRRSRARATLALDPLSAPAHAELALAALLDAEWRIRNARRRGLWEPEKTRGVSGSVWRAVAQAREHLDAGLAADPDAWRLHRLAARLALVTDDSDALVAAAQRAVESRPGDPDALLLAGLAHVWDREMDAAATAFEQALTAMSPRRRAPYTEVRWLLPTDERRAFDADSVSFASTFWERRDPWRLTPDSERQTEHLARMVEADLRYGTVLGDVRGWETARGDTFIRYGRPRAEVGWTAQRFGGQQIWGYDGFTLRFEDEFMNGDYRFASSAYEADDETLARSLANRIGERSSLYDGEGSVEIEALATRLVDEEGQPEWLVAYRTDVPRTRGGAFALDGEGRTVDAQLDSQTRAATSTAFAVFRVSARIDAIRVEAEAGGERGARDLLVSAPEDAGSGLIASQPLLLDGLVDPASPRDTENGLVLREGVWIRPSARSVINLGEPLGAYVETFGLVPGPYRIELALIPTARPGLSGLARRLLGRSRTRGVSTTIEAHADDEREGRALLLDPSGQPPGLYDLRVTVRQGERESVSSRSVTLSDSPSPR